MHDRDKRIIEFYDQGLTLQQTGKIFGVTRERVRQIYLRVTGKAWGDRRREELRKRREKKREAWLHKPYGWCRQCGIPLVRVNPLHRTFFCSLACLKEWNKRDHKIIRICKTCGQGFHPWRTFRWGRAKGKFCSFACYGKSGLYKRDINCQVCGKLVKDAYGRQQYCRECAKEKRKQSHATYWRKRYLWKHYWVEIVGLVLVGLGLLWWNSSYVVVGRRDWETVNREYNEAKQEIEDFEKRLEEEKQELRRRITNPTLNEVKSYIKIHIDGYSGWAIKTMLCESGGNPRAKSKYGEFYGLFQFYPKTYAGWGGDPDHIFDWEEQVRVLANRIDKMGLAEVRKHFPVCGFR